MEADAAFEPDAPLCPAFKPTKTEMKTQRFVDFVQKVFRDQPHLPAFKIVPPSDWKPTKTDIDVDSLVIGTPIQQLAFGKTGSYRALLVEQKALTVAEYRELANSEEKLPPPKCRKDYKLLERHFWKSVTINPPTYGADTPLSLFRPDCDGWGLKDLGDLLKGKEMPDIPGVTSPMTYFGMWKSFFAWHVEDADLYSVNFLHGGAPKIWYCVSPKDKAKFERLAGTLNPEQLRACKGFLRHKDVLISPTVLKQFDIKYQLCKQNPGEYIVLNAAAYHSGFNCGFNTAEAVNFATEDWIKTGKQAIPCTCTSWKDQVNIDMRMFEAESLSMASQSDDSDSEGQAGPCRGPEQHGGSQADRDVTGRKRSRVGDSPAAASKSQRGTSRGASEEPMPRARTGRQSCTSRAAAKPMRAAAMKLSAARKQHGQNSTLMAHLQKLNKPYAIVYGEERKDRAPFDLVVPVDAESASASASGSASKAKVTLQVLKLGKDGLYRPSSNVLEERRSSLVAIRTQLVDPGCRKPGFKLLTLTSRILDQTWV